MRILPGLAYNDMKRLLPGLAYNDMKRILPGLAYNDMKRILPGLTNNDMKLPLAGFSSMAGKNAWPLPGFFLSGLSDVSRGEYPPAPARGFFLTSGAGTPYNDSLYRADLTRKGARGVCIKK